MAIPMQNPYGGLSRAIPGAVSAFYGERDRQAQQAKADMVFQQGQQDRQTKISDRQRNEQDAQAFLNQSQFVAGLQELTDRILESGATDAGIQKKYQAGYDALKKQFPEVAGVRPRPKSAPALANAGQQVEDLWDQTMHTAVANVMRNDPKGAASLMEQIKARKAQREATAAQRAESARRYDEGLQHKRDTAAATAGYRGATLKLAREKFEYGKTKPKKGSSQAIKMAELIALGVPQKIAQGMAYGTMKVLKDKRGQETVVDIATNQGIGKIVDGKWVPTETVEPSPTADYTEEEMQYTMEKHGLTRAQVMKMLEAKQGAR